MKPLTKYGDVYWKYGDGRLKYEKSRGTGSFDVVEFWLKGLGLAYEDPVERRILAGILESDSAEVKGVTTWGDIKSWVSRNPSYLSRLRYLHELATGESHHTLVWVMRLKEAGDDGRVGQLSVLTAEKAEAEYGKDGNILKVRFEADDATGEDRVVNSRGKDWPKFKALLDAVSGQDFFPNAAQLEAESRRFAPQAEIFGSTETICKPEPLFTPAELMKVPPLVRPVDAVDLPKLEGFQTTDPDAVKGFQTPPSDKIPVITPTGAAAVIVVAAILVLADGPLPFGDAAAASLMGARLAFH